MKDYIAVLGTMLETFAKLLEQESRESAHTVAPIHDRTYPITKQSFSVYRGCFTRTSE